MFERIKVKANLTKENDTLFVSVKEPLSPEELDFLYNYVEKENLNLDITKANLTDDDKRFLQESDRFLKEMESIPESEKTSIPQKILDRWQSEVG